MLKELKDIKKIKDSIDVNRSKKKIMKKKLNGLIKSS